MNKITSRQAHKATITIGLCHGYSMESYEATEVLKSLQRLQNRLIEEKRVYLSVNCYESVVVLSEQAEPHLNLQFIDYPKFPLDEQTFKESVEWIAENLIERFGQNRLVIQFHDCTVMIEVSQDIDPRIKKSNSNGPRRGKE